MKRTKEDAEDSVLHIDIEQLISSLPYLNKEEKEDLYLKWTGASKEKGKVIWEGGKILGFQPVRACEAISFKITIDKDKVTIE